MPSIIVPARNNAQFTATCLASLLFSVSRLNLNCEFILIDDASAPEEKVLDAFRLHRANAIGSWRRRKYGPAAGASKLCTFSIGCVQTQKMCR